MKISKLDAFRNYDIKIEFKRIKDDIQLLIFMNEQLMFSSKKKSFKIKEITDHKIVLIKWYLPQYKPYEKTVLLWENKKEQERFRNFCKQFKLSTCTKLQEELMLKMSDYNKIAIA